MKQLTVEGEVNLRRRSSSQTRARVHSHQVDIPGVVDVVRTVYWQRLATRRSHN